MQDPSGDGKIVYLFLPLYKVRMTPSSCYLLPDGGSPKLDVPRTVHTALEYLNTGSSVTQINAVMHSYVTMVWSARYLWWFGGPFT